MFEECENIVKYIMLASDEELDYDPTSAEPELDEDVDVLVFKDEREAIGAAKTAVALAGDNYACVMKVSYYGVDGVEPDMEEVVSTCVYEIKYNPTEEEKKVEKKMYN